MGARAEEPERFRRRAPWACARAGFVVFVVYGLALRGAFGGEAAPQPSAAYPARPAAGLAMAVVLSCVFNIPPLFLGIASPERMRDGIGRAGVFAALLSWYLLPIGVVANGAGGWPLVAAFALQLAFAGRGGRVWTLVEYGATCASILGYCAASETARVAEAYTLSPYSVAAAFLQSLVLAGLEIAIRRSAPEPDDAREPPGWGG